MWFGSIYFSILSISRNQPVVQVSLTNYTSLSLQDVINSVEQQYQVSLKDASIAPQYYRNYEAELGAGRYISVKKDRSGGRPASSVDGDNSAVIISDGRLIDASNAVKAKSEAEKKEEFRRNNPLPKY